jgi:hypothetical protein
MSDLIEAMARALLVQEFGPDTDKWMSAAIGEEYRRQATAALAALRETHHLVPRTDGDDGELVAYLKKAAFDAGRDNMGVDDPRLLKAADRITALSAEVERLGEALERSRETLNSIACEDACKITRRVAGEAVDEIDEALGAKP